jgi:hypothetical protein
MAVDPRPKYALPNFRSARLLGILNVVFATEILVCGLCVGGWVAVMPLWGTAFKPFFQKAEQQMEAARKAEVQALDEEAKKATTVDEKAAIEARKKEVESRPKPSFGSTEMYTMGMDDPTTLAWSWSEVLSGLVLNGLMLASGVGLMHWRPWSRTLGLWTAALKVLRLCLLYGFYIVVIVPVVSQKVGQSVATMMEQQQAMGARGAAMGPEMFVRIYTILYSIYGALMVLCGVIYPAVVIWVLTRPGVKSACSGAFQLPKEPNQPC